ncbi:hypothetical protein Bhyg_04222, partial [Pseudolycoriella hygida]
SGSALCKKPTINPNLTILPYQTKDLLVCNANNPLKSLHASLIFESKSPINNPAFTLKSILTLAGGNYNFAEGALISPLRGTPTERIIFGKLTSRTLDVELNGNTFRHWNSSKQPFPETVITHVKKAKINSLSRAPSSAIQDIRSTRGSTYAAVANNGFCMSASVRRSNASINGATNSFVSESNLCKSRLRLYHKTIRSPEKNNFDCKFKEKAHQAWYQAKYNRHRWTIASADQLISSCWYQTTVEN